MRRLPFWFFLLVLLLVVAACALDRGVSDQGTPEPDATVSDQPGSEATRQKGLPDINLPEIDLPEIDVPAGAVATAQAAVQGAGDVAGTAVHQAGDIVGTAAAVATEQGGPALATAQAMGTPDLTALTERLAAARPDESGNLSVTLNESELNQLLQLRYLVMSAEPEVREASVRFQSGAIVVTGNVPLLLPVDITLVLRPTVTDGRFDLEVVDAALGRVEAPELILGFTSNLVSDALDDVLRRLPEGFQLQSIIVEEGQLTIIGRINSNS
jgi:hypothetical protein